MVVPTTAEDTNVPTPKIELKTQQMIQEFVEPGHFYSVIPNITNDYNNNETKFINLNFNEENHIQILDEIKNYLFDFDKTFGIDYDSNINENIIKRQNELKYTLMNSAFEWMDARLLYYYLQKNKPKKIIEIGSGNSTLLTYNTKTIFNLDVEIICIEPYPSSYLKKLHDLEKIKLIEDKLENVNLELFESLDENDILFIDSSHVLKLDSDVMYYFTKIFPLLKKMFLFTYMIYFFHLTIN